MIGPVLIVASLLQQPTNLAVELIKTNNDSYYFGARNITKLSTGTTTTTTNITTCPPWFIPDSNSTTGCKCGSTHQNIVKCDTVTMHSYILYCYAMAYDQYFNGSKGEAVVAHIT